MVDCRLAIVSYPKGRSSVSAYLILGELTSKVDLRAIAKDIEFLYPFRWDGNLPEDFEYYREKYKLSTPKVVGNLKHGIMCSPILYDLTCDVPVVRKKLKVNFKPKNRVIFTFSYSDPILRGQILSNCLKLCPCSFFLLGSQTTKMCLYLLKQGFIGKNIVKMPTTEGLTTSIVDCMEIFSMIYENEDKEIYIACLSSEVAKIRKHIQKLKYKGILEERTFLFVCEN